MIRKHPLADCMTCPLQNEPYVPSYGPDKADIVVVGEAPGKTEVETGEPFTGLSGQLLQKVLPVPRYQLYITNVCLCRPPDNATPTKKAVTACSKRLEAEIKSREPSKIVTLGATATKSILGPNKKISIERIGAPKECPEYDAEVIPTYHPAAALYNPSLYPEIVMDFKKVLSYEQVGNWSAPTYIVSDTITALDILIPEDVLAIDIEIEVDKDLLDVDPTLYKMLCVGVGTDKFVVVLTDKALEDKEKLVSFLKSKKLIAHNGKFDLKGLRGFTGETFDLWFDTMLASYALDERPGTNSLRKLCIELIGSPDWKAEVDHYGGISQMPAQVLYKYNAYDVANTFTLYKLFSHQLKEEEGLEKLNDFLIRSSGTLEQVEFQGIDVDMNQIDDLELGISSRMEELLTVLRAIVDIPTHNPNSPLQVKKALEKLGASVPNTTAKTIYDLIQNRSSDSIISTFCGSHLSYKRLSKLLGTYVKGIRKREHNSKIHTSYRLHGTETGRLSSRNPNLQNIPRNNDIRKIFVGDQLIHIDYSQAELRAVAWLARDEYLRGVLSDPTRDIHSEVAVTMFGPDFTKEDRVKAKSIVYGLTYGMGANYLADMFNMPVYEAQEYIDTWFSMIPATVDWIESIHATVMSRQELQSPFGHKRRFPLITYQNKHSIFKEATAFLPQNIVSNICLEAANRIKEKGFGHIIRLMIHDAIMFEYPSMEIIPMLTDTMVSTGEIVFGDYIKAEVEVSVGRSWGELNVYSSH